MNGFPQANWSYKDAFARHAGLLTEREQAQLRKTRVAIIGLGGVGGVHLVTLARLGIGAFNIADPDAFEVANFNRQYGANLRTVGQDKVDVMEQEALNINPELDIRTFSEPIGPDNIHEFLDGVDILVDAVDLYAIDVRRALFRRAAEQGIYAISAAPIGFSTAWMVFAPNGMTFDRFFDLSDDMDRVQKILAFILGSSPKATQLAYMDISYLDFDNHVAPSVSPGCQLAAGVMGAEITKILLDRGRVWPVPYYQQFDAYCGRLVRRRLHGGNRHPWQRVKRWWLYRQYLQGTAPWAAAPESQPVAAAPV